MNSTQLFRFLPLLLVASSCKPSPTAAGSVRAADSPGAHQTLLPAASAALDLSVPQGKALTLEEVLHRVSKITGVTFSASGRAEQQVQGSVVTLSDQKSIAPAEVYPWFESLIELHGMTLGILEPGPPVLVGVYLANAGTMAGDNGARPPVTHLEVERIAECRAHPAFRFSTVLTLPHTDVRSVGNSMRILSPDTQSGGVVPVGTTNSVILEGSGRQVANLVAMLQKVDAEAGAAKAAAAPPPKKP